MAMPCLTIEKTLGGTYLGELDILNLRGLLDTHVEMLTKQLEIMSLEFREV